VISQKGNLPHIGLNAHLLSLRQTYRSAGISWYIYNLLTNLNRVEPTYRYTAFLSDSDFQPHKGLAVQRSSWPTHKPAVRILWEQLVLPFFLKKESINLLHALAFVAPVAVRCPFVTTVYDLSFIRYPDAFRPLNRWYLSLFTRYSSKRARAIITISESTRQDVIQTFGVLPDKVRTIYCGVDDSFRPLPPGQVESFRIKQGLPDRFILRLGTIEPRKNVEGVIRAYAAWRARDEKAPKLFIAGGKGWHYEQVFRLVEELNLTEHVVFPGYLPQEELPWWYNAASLFVYPSYFEGFGLPVLEAMACGTPVITSNVSSLPEVAGEAAVMVDPTDIMALSQAMEQMFCDPDLARTRREKGLNQAAKFSWLTSARMTAQVYSQVLS
jgi:glycosyltransferase involved in cell wall biosynthesis